MLQYVGARFLDKETKKTHFSILYATILQLRISAKVVVTASTFHPSTNNVPPPLSSSKPGQDANQGRFSSL
jgi:hypothetical protein